MDKDKLFENLLIGGLIVCIPFMGVYHGVKWLYNQTPCKREERKELNRRIKGLERILGLKGRDDKALHYDPYYIYNRAECREDYLRDLQKKVESGYVSPDIIIAVVYDNIFHHLLDYEEECSVMLLLNSKHYSVPAGATESEENLSPLQLMLLQYNKERPEFRTLSECGRYGDYWGYHVPGRYILKEIKTKEKQQEIIREFKREYYK